MDIFNKSKNYIVIAILIIGVIVMVNLFKDNQQLKTKNSALQNDMQMLDKVLKNLNEQRKEMNTLTVLGLKTRECKDITCQQKLADQWNQALQAREKLEQELPSGLKEILDNTKN